MSAERNISTPATTIVSATSAANASVSVSLPNPGPLNRWVVTGWCITMNGQPAAAVTATLTIQGAARDILLPAVAQGPLPINIQRGIYANDGEQPTLQVPALGGSVASSVWLYGYRARVG